MSMFQNNAKTVAVMLLATGIVTAVSGCGEGGVNSGQLDIVSSVPVNGATGFGIDKVIQIKFSEALDPSTVTPQNLMLMPGVSSMPGMDGNSAMDDMGEMDHASMMEGMADMSVIPADAKCASSRNCDTVTLRPMMSLSYGQTYHLMVHNLRTRAGRTLNGEHAVPLQFTTAFVMRTERERNIDQLSSNPARYRRTTYSYSRVTDPSTGLPHMERSSRTDIDGNNNSSLTTYNATVGLRKADVRYVQNSSTEIDRYYYEVVQNGKVVADVTFDGPGADGQWGRGGDDLIRSFSFRGASHGAHRMSEFYRRTGDSVVEPATLTEAGLRALIGASFTLSAAYLSYYETTTSGASRIAKSIRFSSFGNNGTMDIGLDGNKTAGFDDTIRDYRIYDYDPVHGARVGRTEYDDTGSGLQLNPSVDTPSGYRVYRTASDDAFGNAVGMLRVAEITYRNSGADGAWYYDPNRWPTAGSNAEADNAIRDIELSFYCSHPSAGLYEKYEIEVDMADATSVGANYDSVPAFLAAYESQLASSCNMSKPNQAAVNAMGITGTLEDVDTHQVF